MAFIINEALISSRLRKNNIFPHRIRSTENDLVKDHFFRIYQMQLNKKTSNNLPDHHENATKGLYFEDYQLKMN